MNKKSITLEEISEQKKEIRLRIAEQKEAIQQSATELFAPVRATGKMEHFMNSVNSGIAAYDGVMTGLRIIRRVRGMFKRKK